MPVETCNLPRRPADAVHHNPSTTQQNYWRFHRPSISAFRIYLFRSLKRPFSSLRSARTRSPVASPHGGPPQPACPHRVPAREPALGPRPHRGLHRPVVLDGAPGAGPPGPQPPRPPDRTADPPRRALPSWRPGACGREEARPHPRWGWRAHRRSEAMRGPALATPTSTPPWDDHSRLAYVEVLDDERGRSPPRPFAEPRFCPTRIAR
jgi:hypothetical protein